jgi:tryptophan synthase alpha chain
MSRIAAVFAQAREQERAALICYAMGGDPSLAATEELLLALDRAGADVIELGVPFSDPIADGPAIQAAAVRALAAGTTLRDLLAMAARLRGKLRAPLVLMGYANPFYSFGLASFCEAAEAAGIAGVIVPDLPLEESGELRELLSARGLELILLCAPTTGPERLVAIAQASRGFLYTVSVTGVTGARVALPTDLTARLDELRALSPVPVAVGFGISTAEQARELALHADGIVVGSALVLAHHKNGANSAAALVTSLLPGLRHHS